jgi:hypothetical protein
MYALEILIDRLRTARFVGRALALVKELGPYAAVELILPGGTLIALGLWLYARHKAGKPLLPWALSSRPAIEGLFKSRSEAPCQP